TVEEVELMDLTIVKREGKRETYSREKLLKGIVRSLEKRPYTEAGLKTLMHSIEQDIQRTKQQELSSAELGDVVMERLRTFDKVAYIRFASVYRQFEDVQTFQRELNELIRKRNKTI
ncbi:MAG TPA: ATP cone domain-containing protein, partial [Patescibacteria group bacterium]|nr:ATP cone domain-containing protein [Patescibacteria group bacterium]